METSATTNNLFRPGSALSDGVLDHAAVNMHGSINKLSASANEAVGTVKPVIDRVAQAAHHSVDKVADAAAPTAAWLSAQGENLASTQRNAVAKTRGYVSAHPLQAVGIGMAVAFLLGRLAR